MDLGIEGRVALILGGSGRVGRAAAEQLQAEGVTVVLAARDATRLEAASVALGHAPWQTVDGSDDASVLGLIENVLAIHGTIDILVGAAAPAGRMLIARRDWEPQQMLSEIDAKAMVALRAMNAVLPHMLDRGWGRVVNVSGQNALISGSVTAAARNNVLTVVSKAAADAVAGSGVTVNVVHPGFISDKPVRDRGLGLPGDTTFAEVGAAIAFLCGNQAGAISGETLAIGHRVKGTMIL